MINKCAYHIQNVFEDIMVFLVTFSKSKKHNKESFLFLWIWTLGFKGASIIPFQLVVQLFNQLPSKSKVTYDDNIVFYYKNINILWTLILILNYKYICKFLFVVWIWIWFFYVYVDMYVKFMLVYFFFNTFLWWCKWYWTR